MSSEYKSEVWYRKWFRKVRKTWRPAPIGLNLSPPPPKQAPDRAASPELVPGNYFMFKFFIELTLGGVAHLGYPKQAIRVAGSPSVISWGSPIELAYPNPSIPRVPWIDDPKTGLSQRKIQSAEDLLGTEGILGGKRYVFEQVLNLGKNQVTYSLFAPETRTRIAYGFSRELFEGTKLSA
jgi:hypothetical protein